LDIFLILKKNFHLLPLSDLAEWDFTFYPLLHNRFDIHSNSKKLVKEALNRPIKILWGNAKF